MLPTHAYAAKSQGAKLEPYSFERREPGAHDVVIKILYCGICHSDIHQVNNDWGIGTYPMVPGHEIVGKITRIGSAVKKFKENDLVGVGCFVDSCRKCSNCKDGEQQLCDDGASFTYASMERDKITPTQGGYSSQIVVDENYVLKVSSKLNLANAAPLLCAGITTYSPMKQYKVSKGQKVGIVGLGGLGHMGVKFAAAMGAEVTVFSTSKSKEKDALRLGAQHFVATQDPKNLEKLASQFDFILDTVAAPHDPNMYLNLVRRDGVMVLVGIPEKPLEVQPFSLIVKRRKLAGSLIGGIRETQEMLDYCAEKNITSDVEIIPVQKIQEAFDRTIKGDVRYRFVIDMNTL